MSGATEMVGTLVGIRVLLVATPLGVIPLFAVTSHVIDCPISAACVT